MIGSKQEKMICAEYGSDWRLKYLKSEKFKTTISSSCVLKCFRLAENKTGKWSRKILPKLQATTMDQRYEGILSMNGFHEVNSDFRFSKKKSFLLRIFQFGTYKDFCFGNLKSPFVGDMMAKSFHFQSAAKKNVNLSMNGHFLFTVQNSIHLEI